MDQKDNRPLFTLTVQEYIEINKVIINERPNNQIEQPPSKNERDIIYLEEAAALTGYTHKTVYTKVSRREIPVVSVGRPLTFSRKQLREWIEQGRPTVGDMMAQAFINRQNKK